MGFFFFNDTATTEIYTLSLHDALPISLVTAVRDMRNGARTTGWLHFSLSNANSGPGRAPSSKRPPGSSASPETRLPGNPPGDRKSTRLNSSHLVISYAVFCLKKKNIDV